MGSFDHSAATLRIFGDDLEPNEVTRLLGCEPSVAQRTGEIVKSTSGRERAVKRGNWRLVAERAKPEDLDGQIRWILSRTTNDITTWKSLVQRYDVDLFCGLFMAGSNDGFSLSPDVLLMLGERGIEIGFDVYDAGDDRTPASNSQFNADASGAG